MLSRRTLLERPLPSTLTPFPSCSCSLLGAPRKVNAFKISALQPLLQNTRGGGTPTLLRRAPLPPSYAPRGAAIPCALNRLRILPVTTGGVPPVSHYPLRSTHFCRPLVVSTGGVAMIGAFAPLVRRRCDAQSPQWKSSDSLPKRSGTRSRP